APPAKAHPAPSIHKYRRGRRTIGKRVVWIYPEDLSRIETPWELRLLVQIRSLPIPPPQPPLPAAALAQRRQFAAAYSVLERAVADQAFPGAAFGVLAEGKVR